MGTELQKVEPPRGKLPALKMPDPAFLVGRLRAGKSAGFLSRQARRRRVGARQFLVNEVGLAVKKGVFVWAVVTQGEPERFRDLAAVPKKLREGIDQFTLEEFSTVSPLHFMPFEIVVVFEEPIELKKPPPGRRFASEIEIAEARKGFPNSVVEGGIHVHTLDRDKKTTREDGAHTHLFALPDGKTIVTEEDGVHTHALANSGANKSAEDGAHTHRVRMPDGSIVETVAGGNHAHQLQVFYSAFDGLHQHELKIGEHSWRSASPGEFWNKFRERLDAPDVDAPPASQLAQTGDVGKQLDVENVDAVRLRQLSDEEFKTTASRIGSAYSSGFKGNDKNTYRGLSREDVVNAALFVLDDAKRRDLDVKFDSALVDEVQQLRQKAAEDSEYATIHASGEEQGDVLKLDEVLGHLKSFKLRMPLLYLVGGLANRGETPNDIDLLVKGPLSPELRHALEFRLGRMFPPELSRRIQFLDDEFGGPFTRHVELADLVVEMRPQFDVKQMVLAKQDDPLLDLPKKRGPRPAVFQYHFRGKSLHGDLRLQVDDFLVGWTLVNQRSGAIKQPVETVANARRIAQSFSLDGDRFTKPMRAPAKLFAAPKSRQPLIWLGIDNRVFEEGEVGATRNEEGVMVIASKPKVEFGLQKSFSHEYFFTGKTELRGTMFFRQLVGKADDDRETPPGEAFWTSWVSKELMPSVLGRRAVKTKSMPPDGHSAIPISLERVTPKEFRYWERKGNEARTVRDALVDERFFTDDNIKLVDGQYKRVVTEKKFFVPADLPDDAAVEELPRRKQTVEILQKYVGGRDLAIVVPVGLPFEEWSDYFALCAKQNDGAVLVTTPPHPQSEGNEDAIVDAIVGVTTDFIVELSNSAYALAALAKIGRPFRIAGKGGRLYVASLPPASKVDIEWIDLADATYALGGQTSSWTKLKLARIVNAIVHGRDSVKDSPGVWNYFGAVGPIPKADTGKWKETVEVGGKLYVPIGTTGNSKVDAKVGDVIIAEVSEILFTETEPFRLRWFGPASVVKLSDRKSSSGIQEVLDLLEPGERKKSMSPDDELLLGERVVKVVRPKDAEERYVLGIVLEPETIDAQRDIYSHEEVRQVAHKFMERFQNIGLMHQTVINSRVKILESFLAPSDFKVGRQLVKRGTWLLAVRIKDDDLWKKVKTEGLTGFSIGGSAVRVPDA